MHLHFPMMCQWGASGIARAASRASCPFVRATWQARARATGHASALAVCFASLRSCDAAALSCVVDVFRLLELTRGSTLPEPSNQRKPEGRHHLFGFPMKGNLRFKTIALESPEAFFHILSLLTLQFTNISKYAAFFYASILPPPSLFAGECGSSNYYW